MSVKRYDMKEVFKGRMAVVETSNGAFVTNIDYEELAVQLANAESKCRELATENAKLSDCANFYRLGFKPVKGAFGIEYRPTEQLLDDCGNTAIDAIKTPATDAFLAEVRAQGVDAAIDTAKNVVAHEFQYKDFETAQQNCSNFPESDLVGKVEMVEWLEEFGAQLRKGAAL